GCTNETKVRCPDCCPRIANQRAPDGFPWSVALGSSRDPGIPARLLDATQTLCSTEGPARAIGVVNPEPRSEQISLPQPRPQLSLSKRRPAVERVAWSGD